MDLQRRLVCSGQQTISLCPPFSIKQQQEELEHCARTKHFKRQSLSCSISGREDRQKPPPVELTEEEWASVTQFPQHNLSSSNLSHEKRRAAKEEERLLYRPRQEPAWLRHDRQALRFFAFFQEPFSGSATENTRRRYCIILFHLSDGTIRVLECTTDNGTTHQGCLLKRHKAPKADGTGFITLTDFRLGCDIELYKRVFRLVDCDEFTRWFCHNSGHEVGEAEPLPYDACFHSFVAKKRGTSLLPQAVLEEIRAARSFAEASLGNSCRNESLLQYLQNDGKVLVFNCYWDNKENIGCRTYYNLHYFLSDDSVEIKISPIKNSGCAAHTTFLRKGKLPKKLKELTWSDCKQSRSEFYTPQDFIIGKEIDVYGRSFHLYDCDAFTRQFYREYLQIEQGREIIQEEKPEVQAITWPPHALGIGTDEDTLQSCLRINPRKPHPNEREILFGEDFTLNFKAELVSKLREDEGREFRISIRELNNKITVFEYPKRNSGHVNFHHNFKQPVS